VPLFIDLRASAKGGIVADAAQAWVDGTTLVSEADFAGRLLGKDILLATHGFNVDRQGGIDSLSLWNRRCTLPSNALFIGVLWPGDSRFLPFVDYVYEGSEAISSGKLLATYLNKNSTLAQSLSFFSHSLGARTVLETIRGLNTKPRRAILMAGAIEDTCLAKEYADAAAKIGKICVVASVRDDVLKWAFPPGNLIGEIVMHGHPYDRTALGRSGPFRPLPPNLSVVHLDYLAQKSMGPPFAVPLPIPNANDPIPVDANDPNYAGWKPAWSAAGAVTQFL
jgi:Alpha/beta hydrolase of unknown function (DUF900)